MFDSPDLHIQTIFIFIADQVFRDDHMYYEESDVYSIWHQGILFVLFIFNHILDSLYIGLNTYSISYSSVIILLEIYMLYCSGYHVIIVN